MKRLIVAGGLLVALALAAAEAGAQTATARGKVVDEHGQGVPDVKIELEYLGGVTRKLETKTNKKGEFTQVGLQSGVYRFTATKDGYQGSYLEAKVVLGDPTYLPEIKILSKAAAVAAKGGAEGELAEIKSAVEKAIELTRAGKLDEAEALYKDAIARKPALAVLHYNLGALYSLRKDAAAAEAEYRKAIEVDPGYAQAYVGITNLYLSAGQLGKAEEFIRNAAAEHPDSGAVQFQLGFVLFNTGKSAEAQGAFEKAVSLEPANAEPHFYLGSIAVGQGKTDVCLAELEKYLSMSPDNPQNVATAQGLIAALKPKK